MANKLMITGWILIIIAFLGVEAPHIAFLLDLIPTLDIISHSVFEIIIGVIGLVGVILIAMSCLRRR